MKLLFIAFLSFFLIGCKQINQYSPDKVISNALAAEDEVVYYGELRFDFEGMDEFDNEIIKEWRQNNKSRVEIETDDGVVLAVSDGESTISYIENEKQAVKINNELFEAMEVYNTSPREQVESILDMISDTHEIESVGKEKIANRDTFHLIAKKNKDVKSLFGDQEFWIDKEHWVVLKMKMTNGDVENIIEYTKIDFNPKLDDSLFQLDLPEDVTVQTIDNIDDIENFADDFTEEIALDEIYEKMGQKVLHLPDNDTHKLDKTTFTEIEGVQSYTDITIDYKNKDGKPLLTLTIIATDDDDGDVESIFSSGEEEVDIRGEQGIFYDFEEFRFVNWAEGGLRYSIDLIDPDLTLEDVKKFTKEMKEIK